MISIMTDITEQLKREEILKYEAGYDSLTGLNNRKNAVSLMEKEFNRKAGGYFFICDVDNFKSVNDTKGHLFGDNVLIKLADIMRKQAGDKSILARLGGDEYILFFHADINKYTFRIFIFIRHDKAVLNFGTEFFFTLGRKLFSYLNIFFSFFVLHILSLKH